jgi:hypothetical protein
MAHGQPLRGHTGWVNAVAVGEVDGMPTVVGGDSDGTISMWAIDRVQNVSARLAAPATITAMAYGGPVSWLIATNDGTLFTLRPTPVSESAT